MLQQLQIRPCCRSRIAPWIAGFLLALLPAHGYADETVSSSRVVISGGGGEYTAPVRTLLDVRFTDVIRQRYDFSCGSAALATLLTYHYDMPVSEMGILGAMYQQGDKEKIHKEGFSLLDMKAYLTSLGLRAEGYRASLDKLAAVGVPAIVLINRNGYMHFVVVKGFKEDRVLVGDPAKGLIAYSRAEFESMWNGILFVVVDMKDVARPYFNSRDLWAKRRLSLPNEFANNTSLSTFTLSITTPSNYY